MYWGLLSLWPQYWGLFLAAGAAVWVVSKVAAKIAAWRARMIHSPPTAGSLMTLFVAAFVSVWPQVAVAVFGAGVVLGLGLDVPTTITAVAGLGAVSFLGHCIGVPPSAAPMSPVRAGASRVVTASVVAATAGAGAAVLLGGFVAVVVVVAGTPVTVTVGVSSPLLGAWRAVGPQHAQGTGRGGCGADAADDGARGVVAPIGVRVAVVVVLLVVVSTSLLPQAPPDHPRPLAPSELVAAGSSRCRAVGRSGRPAGRRASAIPARGAAPHGGAVRDLDNPRNGCSARDEHRGPRAGAGGCHTRGGAPLVVLALGR